MAGMGTLNNIGVHALDILRYLIGSEVADVAAMASSEPGFEVDTTDLVLLRFGNGTLAQLNASQAVPHPRDDIALYGTEGRVLAPNLSRPDRDAVVSFITRDGERPSRPRPVTPTCASSRPSPTPSPAAATRARPARTGCAAWNSPWPSRTRSASAGSSRCPAR